VENTARIDRQARVCTLTLYIDRYFCNYIRPPLHFSYKRRASWGLVRRSVRLGFGRVLIAAVVDGFEIDDVVQGCLEML